MAQQTPPKAEKDRSERWLLTYSDLITLLLIFFVIMYVFSVQDLAKFQQMASSLKGTLSGTNLVVGMAPGPSMVETQNGESMEISAIPDSPPGLDEIVDEVDAISVAEGVQASISVMSEERGIVIRIVDEVLFYSGNAELTPKAMEILGKIGEMLKRTTEYIRIEGHTDNVPISTPAFPSNWELSAGRATNVLRLLANVGIDPRRLSAAGYAEFRPIADNAYENGRAKNRRVEIILLNGRTGSK
jgi:chemotaxis protein MotB